MAFQTCQNRDEFAVLLAGLKEPIGNDQFCSVMMTTIALGVDLHLLAQEFGFRLTTIEKWARHESEAPPTLLRIRVVETIRDLIARSSEPAVQEDDSRIIRSETGYPPSASPEEIEVFHYMIGEQAASYPDVDPTPGKPAGNWLD